ncbi:MAG: 3-methyl-2-oxobutanoate hydroxymethyltransferase [Clostridiales Family XIII bacterium]|jgi:3-methyl-2-oxobutanoate hydroxymethyltransferase|nr:3-methyl-2-oxobutanoate hydroxymethyltransferase [Clostridiales Family XIII bacterium]
MDAEKITVTTIHEMKKRGEPISMVTAYDFAMAKNADEAGVEMLLVGDSLGNVMLGYPSTVPVTMDEMIHHTKAVARAQTRALVVGDMPFMSYQAEEAEGMRNAGRLMKEGGCTAVKLEGGEEVAPLVKKMVSSGIPVCGHIGLTPQSVHVMGGFKVQGKDLEAAKKLIRDAKALEAAGAFAIVFECVPSVLAKKLTAELTTVATIGIGGGNGCDGQVLVCNDLLGFSDGFCPKFVKKYADLHSEIVGAFKSYVTDVKSRSFPDEARSFGMDEEVLSKLY